MKRRWGLGIATGLLALGYLAIQSSDEQSPLPGERTVFAQADDANKKEAADPTAAEKKANRKKNQNQAKKNQNANALPEVPAPPTAEAGGANVLSKGDSYDDFVSVAQGPDGSIYSAYAAYFDGHDEIRFHRRQQNGNWSKDATVPLAQARADIWMPQIAVDATGRLWMIWSEQTAQTRHESGNWDIYARPLDAQGWGAMVRLTNDPKPDIHPHVTVDAKHNIYVVWQAHPDNTGDIQLCKFDGANWSKPIAVTQGADSDWFPQAAVDVQGKVWIAFDSYRNGDFDVFLTSVEGDKPGPVIPIATSKYYEAHASVACAADGKVWVAWEQGGINWGKDNGYWLNFVGKDAGAKDLTGPKGAHPTGAGKGTALGSTRSVQVAVYQNDKVMSLKNHSLPTPAANSTTAMAGLAAGDDGRVWLRYRQMNAGAPKKDGKRTRYWSEQIVHATDQGWSQPVVLPASEGRISVFSRIVPAQDGSLLVGYSSDQRGPNNYHQPVHDRALFYTVAKPAAPVTSPELVERTPPPEPEEKQRWDGEREKTEVAAARAYRAEFSGENLQIVRGDLHRHTELSWDVGPGNDGSFLDFYRYMIDVASMDFGGLSDHQGGGGYAYHWWLTEKTSDLYYLAPRFVPLYGYERSVKFPDGHRNVFHSYRGVPVFGFQTKFPNSANGISGGEGLVSNDTKLLYEYLRGTGGVAISHTSGTSSMGTDWRDNDPVIEPIVEIYQGARNSYETLGAPRVHDILNRPANDAPGGFQEAGMVWNAYAKGYRLGTITSSDHGSTHISYAAVYTPHNKREDILNAIRKRHTYGSTGNLIVDFRANGHFMGEEFSTADLPSFRLKVVGTGDIERIDLIRNARYIYTANPGKKEVDLNYVDMEPSPGLNYYYFRILQKDSEVAWASPIWINYAGKGK